MGQTFSVDKVTADYNAVYNNVKGVMFHLDMHFWGMKGQTVEIRGALFQKDASGKWVKVQHVGTLSYYRAKELTVFARATQKLSVGQADAMKDDLKVFLPWDAIKHPKGRIDYSIGFYVSLPDGSFAKENGQFYHYFYFNLNWPQATIVNTSQGAKAQNKADPSGEQRKRTNFSDGGFWEDRNNADGTSSSHLHQKCYSCEGSGKCQSCMGYGEVFIRTVENAYYVPCVCYGSGKCSACRGTGWRDTYFTTDKLGTTESFSTSGYSSTRYSDGSIVVRDPSGKVVDYKEGYGGMSSSERSKKKTAISAEDYVMYEKIAAEWFSTLTNGSYGHTYYVNGILHGENKMGTGIAADSARAELVKAQTKMKQIRRSNPGINKSVYEDAVIDRP